MQKSFVVDFFLTAKQPQSFGCYFTPSDKRAVLLLGLGANFNSN